MQAADLAQRKLNGGTPPPGGVDQPNPTEASTPFVVPVLAGTIRLRSASIPPKDNTTKTVPKNLDSESRVT